MPRKPTLTAARRHKRRAPPRRVCFVTGTRAEFGLMQPVLRAMADDPALSLQLLVTGMHLDRAHGDGLGAIRGSGWHIDGVVPWRSGSGRDRATTARNTGLAVAALVDQFERLASDVVLVVGDRVEAFAAATAAHLSGRVVAHVHGGDRAAGQVDDCLRHATAKLAHVHFPATRKSAERLFHMGEDRWRIRRVGSPGLDGIVATAADRARCERVVGRLTPGRFALVLLHPVDADDALEESRAAAVLRGVAGLPVDQVLLVHPNNDPGNRGIARCWARSASAEPDARIRAFHDLPRDVFLGLMRDAVALVGNSSSGIIEAASFGTPVVNVGPRQRGRERGANVIDVPYDPARIRRALGRIWNGGRPRRFRSENVYGGGGAGRRIADALARLTLDQRLRRKLVRY